MDKYVITGASGFVARHFLDYLNDSHEECDILCLDICKPKFDFSLFSYLNNIRFVPVDLMNKNQLSNILMTYKPDYVLHLAAHSSVAYSWKHPADSFTNNCIIFLNLIDSIRENNISCRILSIGSSEEYGNVSECDLPLTEDRMLEPVSPYAISRVSQELLSKLYVKNFNMNIVLTRSFNHIGPGQDDRFVIPSFIKQIIDIKQSNNPMGIIETGDLNIVRDFVDVRDVVRAYYLLLKHGKPGEIYNVCSGKAIKLSDIIMKISKIVGVDVTTHVNPEFIRPQDNKVIVGSALKIEKEFNWRPQIEIDSTLNDMINEKIIL